MENTHVVVQVVSGNAGVSVTVCPIGSEESETYLVERKLVRSLGLAQGVGLTPDTVARLADEAELCRAEARTVRILSYSDHSVNALVRKLISYGFSEDIARRSAQSAVEKGYINEEEQAARCADYFLRHKYWGKKRIAMELISRGYGRSAVNDAIMSVDDSLFMATVEKLIEKKYPEPPSGKAERDKMCSALSRMGYSLSEIFEAMKKVYGE